MWINYRKECANLSQESRRAILTDITQAITWHMSVWSDPAQGEGISPRHETGRVAVNGSLVYLQDITAAYFSSLAVIVYKLFWRLSVGQKGLMVDAIREIHRLCSESANGGLNSPSAALSRAPTPSGNGTGGSADVQEASTDGGLNVVAAMDTFLSQFGEVDQSFPIFDQSYWSTLSSVPLATFEQLFE
ncbi:hypothetical protein IAT40_004209 [Kwoniella sp. CBS 6097]